MARCKKACRSASYASAAKSSHTAAGSLKPTYLQAATTGRHEQEQGLANVKKAPTATGPGMAAPPRAAPASCAHPLHTSEEEMAALEKRLADEVEIRTSAEKALVTRGVEMDMLKKQLESSLTQLIDATNQCKRSTSALSTMSAALHTNEANDKERAALERRLIAQVGQIQAASKAALAKEQAARELLEAEFKKLKEQLANRNSQLPAATTETSTKRMEEMRGAMVEAQQSAKQASKDKETCERAAAKQLHAAHQQMIAKDQDILELRIANQAVKQQAARVIERAAATQEAACYAHTHKEAANARATAAEALLGAAQIETESAHMEAGAAHERSSLLQAEVNAKDAIILALQGQVHDLAPTNTTPTPGPAELTKLAASWLADQALETLMHPLLSPEGMTGKLVRQLPLVSIILRNAPALRTMLQTSWLGI